MAFHGDSVSPEPSREKSHTFPALDGMTTRSAGDPQAIHSSFKPLFQDACSHLSPQRHPGSAQSADTQDYEEHIRQTGIQRGFDAGREDACKLTRQAIAPEISAVLSELDQMSEYLVRVEENSCRQIIKMAVSIAENILVGAPGCTTGWLDSLKAELKDRLAKLYQLELTLNPEDLHTLSEFMACSKHQWQEFGCIKLRADAQIERGYLLTQTDAQPVAADDSLTRSLEEILDKASTK